MIDVPGFEPHPVAVRLAQTTSRFPARLDALLTAREIRLARVHRQRRRRSGAPSPRWTTRAIEVASDAVETPIRRQRDGKCAVCRRPVEPVGARGGRPRETCSPECASIRKRQRDAERRRHERATERTLPADPANGYGSLVTSDLGIKPGTEDWQAFHEGHVVYAAPTSEDDAHARRVHRDRRRDERR